jgi:2-haloacid dehalogenase
MTPPTVVVFDLGGVLFDWDPRHLYRQLLPDEEAVEHFLATVCTLEWNAKQDLGRSVAEAVAELSALHPDKIELIQAYYDRWHDAIGGTIDGSVELLERLHRDGVRLYGLSNWPADTFPAARRRYPFLSHFRDIVVSGEVKLGKPDPRIFELLFRRCDFRPEESVFIDDVMQNIEVARRLGMRGIHFQSPAETERQLRHLRVLAQAG